MKFVNLYLATLTHDEVKAHLDENMDIIALNNANISAGFDHDGTCAEAIRKAVAENKFLVLDEEEKAQYVADHINDFLTHDWPDWNIYPHYDYYLSIISKDNTRPFEIIVLRADGKYVATDNFTHLRFKDKKHIDNLYLAHTIAFHVAEIFNKYGEDIVTWPEEE